jgi:hypothetical protein
MYCILWQGTMEGNLIENKKNVMNKGLANLLICEKLKHNLNPLPY